MKARVHFESMGRRCASLGISLKAGLIRDRLERAPEYALQAYRIGYYKQSSRRHHQGI